tara:strand:+ start:284 stop:856 length:573 start_codon:yes stop_codon:yes gene_type:complete
MKKMHAISGNKRFMTKRAIPLLRKYGIQKSRANLVGGQTLELRFLVDDDKLERINKELKKMNRTAYDGIMEQLREIIREELKSIKVLKESVKEKFGLQYDDEDHYVIDRSLEKMGHHEGVGYSESWDVYSWQDQNNFSSAVKELNAVVLKEYAVFYKAKVAFEKKADYFYKEKDKIFKKWRKKDGSGQGW